MLRPTKHSHPDRTVVNAALLLLTRLKRKRLEEYDALKQYTKKRIMGGDVLFLPAIDLVPFRQMASFSAVAVLLFGFVWDAD